MTTFDPYQKWFGINSDQRPPNHYDLLGVPEFESNETLIRSQGEKRVAFLQDVSVGKDVDDAQRILNEVAQAIVCLTDPDKKRSYDQKLREKDLPVARTVPQQTAGNQVGAIVVEQPASPVKPAARKSGASIAKRPKRKSNLGTLVALVSVAILVVAVLVSALVVANGSNKNQPTTTEKKAPPLKMGYERPDSEDESSLPSMQKKKTVTSETEEVSAASQPPKIIVSTFDSLKPVQGKKIYDIEAGKLTLGEGVRINNNRDEALKLCHLQFLKGKSREAILEFHPEIPGQMNLVMMVEKNRNTSMVQLQVDLWRNGKWVSIERDKTSDKIGPRKDDKKPTPHTLVYSINRGKSPKMRFLCTAEGKDTWSGLLIGEMRFVPNE